MGKCCGYTTKKEGPRQSAEASSSGGSNGVDVQAALAKGENAFVNSGVPAEVNRPYPEKFDLIQESEGFTYRLGQSGSALYLSSEDPPGKSICNDDCARQWIPVGADAGAPPIGNWNIIVRRDGQLQWAFKNQPVYVRASDQSDRGPSQSGTFHLFPHFR
jgi:predicted lipoprotein with Yx(FWY)xxD motif